MITLAVDFGDARTGLAVSDANGQFAFPRPIIHEHNLAPLLKGVTAVAQAEKATRIVVGQPRNMNGTLGEKAEKYADWAEQLQQVSGLPVVLWDERQTTVMAIQVLNVTNTRGKKRKAVVDSVAAVILLESYLASQKDV